MAYLIRKITTNDAKQDLSAAVDVYGEWVDAAGMRIMCDSVLNKAKANKAPQMR
jgi:hypothetical protein